MRELQWRQQEAMAAMRACLDALSVAEKTHVPDLTAAALEEFLKQKHVASWMRRKAGALKEFVAVRGSAGCGATV